MEFNRNFREFPVWGKVVAWATSLGIVAVMGWYAVTRTPALVAELLETAATFLG